MELQFLIFFLLPMAIIFPLFSLTTGKEPTIAARISTKGIDFFSVIGHKIVEHELPRTDFPPLSLPIDGGLGSGRVNVSDLAIIKFESPLFEFQLDPPNGIQFRSHNGTVKVRGNWSASYTIGVTVYANGWVEALAQEIRSTLRLGLFQRQGHPQLQVFSCDAHVVDVQVRIGGGFLPWLVDLFHDSLSKAVKDEINSQFCTTVKSALLDEANTKLMSLPTHIPITSTNNTVFVDYDYASTPVVTSSYVQQSAFVDVVLGTNGTCSSVPVGKPLRFLGPASNTMLSVWFSSQILNCFLDSLHRSGLLQMVVNKDTAGGKFAGFLETKCRFYELLCLGHYFPELARLYPDQHIDLVFRSAEPANVTFLDQNRGLNGTSRFFVDFYISPWNVQKAALARLSMDAAAHIIPVLFDGKLKGKADSVITNFEQVFSDIGNFSPRFLRVFDLLMRPVVEIGAKWIMSIGIPLPAIEKITLATVPVPVLTTFGGADQADELRLDADLVYTSNYGQTFVARLNQ